MEEKKTTKINLSTFFLIVSIIIIIVLCIFIYKLYNDKTTEIQKSTGLQTQINNLNSTINDLQGKINTISETIFDVLENAGVNQSDLANMSVSEQIAYIQSLMDNSSTYLSEVFDELGLSVTSVTDSFNELKNADLPSVIKLTLLENQASTGYNSTSSSSGKSGTTINVATVYGSVDSTFVNMVNKAVGSSNVKRTGN